MQNCVFCRILAGLEPVSVVFADDEIVCFMDIRPVRAGQALIIPRRHVDHFDDLPEALAAKIFLAGQRLARALRSALNPRRAGMVVHGFGVPHAHLVVLPLEHSWDITSAQNAYVDGDAIKFAWERLPLVPREELDQMATRLRSAFDAIPPEQRGA